MKTIVVAEKYAHARAYAEQHNIPPKDLDYVNDAIKLWGRARGTTVYVMDTAFRLKNISEIEEIIEQRQFNRVFVRL